MNVIALRRTAPLPPYRLQQRAILWWQCRAWSGVRYWMRACEAGDGRHVVRSLFLPEGVTPSQVRT